MKFAGLGLAFGLAVGLGAVSAASSTTIYVSPHNGSIAGQTVTFTASFNFSCGHEADTHYFVIDRKAYSGIFKQQGHSATETLAVSTLTVGSHAVSYQWQASTSDGSSCQGAASLYYSVAASAAPPSSIVSSASGPSPSPSTGPSPSSGQSLPDLTNATKVLLKAAPHQPQPEYGYLAGALIALALWAGVGLVMLARD
jgi:hypothetical protein